MAKDKRFGWGLMGYWGGVLVLGMIHKAWSVFRSRHAVRGTHDPETRLAMRQVGSGRGPLASVCHAFRTYILTPATLTPLSDHHQQLWWSHAIPKRIDSLIVFGFWAVSIILGCVKYDSFLGNIEWVFFSFWRDLENIWANRCQLELPISSNRTGSTHQTALVSYPMPVCHFFGYSVGGIMSFSGWRTLMSSHSTCSTGTLHGSAPCMPLYIQSTTRLFLSYTVRIIRGFAILIQQDKWIQRAECIQIPDTTALGSKSTFIWEL